MLRKLLKIIVFLIVWLMPVLVCAYSPSIENGIAWLSVNQNPDGSWGNNADLRVLDTSTVLDTFKSLNISNSAYSNGITWLSNQSPLSTDFISREIISLYHAGLDISADLATLVDSRNLDGGWGGDADSTSMIVDTALALQSLKTVNYSDQNVIYNAISYLLSTQNADGGFGSGGASPAPTTTIYETALAYIALVGVTTDNTVLGNAINYLVSTQSPDGSWLQDPYLTTLKKHLTKCGGGVVYNGNRIFLQRED